MRDIATKSDGSSTLTAAEFNSYMNELENMVTRSGQSLDSGAGPDTDLFQLARSALLHALAGQSYQDGGVANTFVLTSIQSFEQPDAYFDGMVVRFKAAATNTGACTINVGGLGAVSFTLAGGGAYTAGLIGAGNMITAQFFSATNRFEEVANTTPELSGPAAPNQIAIYSDAGSTSAFTLTIEPGYIQPSAFTDQMAVLFKAANGNNGVGTHALQITGLGTRDIVEQDNSDPEVGRVNAGDWVLAVFQEVRNKFEIAFVYERPQPDMTLPAIITSSSGTLYNMDTPSEVRQSQDYLDGMFVFFRAPQTNTGSVDININGIGQRDLRRFDGQNFGSGEIPTNAIVIAQYILSEDRFRGFALQLQEDVKDLTDNRAIRYDLITNSPISNIGAPTLQWGNIAFDELGFNSGGNPNIPAGQDIARVDINCNVNPSLIGGETASLVIELNGNAIGGNTVQQGAGSNNISVTLHDVVVSSGDTIRALVDLGAGGARGLTGSLTVRVSKFSA